MSARGQVAANRKISACPEKIRLAEDYKAALEAILALESKIDIVPIGECVKLLTSIDAARKLAVQAHRAINAHIAEHDC
jgi:hypothetical protein